jgi:hypothetical protein
MTRDAARSSLLRRARLRSVPPPGTGAWSCPDCGLPIQDPVAARLGFCPGCHEFTGMCAAGRRIVCPDLMSVTTWHTPCTSLGALAWQLCEGTTSRVTLLCVQHDAEARAGRTSFLGHATTLTPAGA